MARRSWYVPTGYGALRRVMFWRSGHGAFWSGRLRYVQAVGVRHVVSCYGAFLCG